MNERTSEGKPVVGTDPECICNGDTVTVWDCPCDECQEIREPYEAENEACPACGNENAPTGSLGSREHYNCRDCGMWYSA